MPFNPEEHLIQLPKRVKDKKTGEWITIDEDYLEVKWRLCWFRDRFPHGTIVTEEVCVELDRVVSVSIREFGKERTKTGTGYARYRTTVTDGEGGMATGYGTENAADFADFCERAETRSIGRALAGLGIGTQFIGQEMTEMDHIVDGPVKSGTPGVSDEVSGHLDAAVKQHVRDTGEGANGPFVGSSLPGDALTAAQAPVTASASRTSASGTRSSAAPKTEDQTKTPLLNTEQLKAAINQEFKRLGDTYNVATLCQKGWGTSIDSLEKVRPLPDGSLRNGLKKLQAIRTEKPTAVPPDASGVATTSPEASSASAEEDVPTFPPPGGNRQEGPQNAQGATQGDGPTQGAEVASTSNGEPRGRQCLVYSKTGIRCLREPHEHGEHYFAPPRPEERLVKLADEPLVVPDPDTGVRYVSTSDSMSLQRWCQQQGEPQIFASAVSGSPRNLHGNVMVTEELWHKIKAAVMAMVNMKVPSGALT